MPALAVLDRGPPGLWRGAFHRFAHPQPSRRCGVPERPGRHRPLHRAPDVAASCSGQRVGVPRPQASLSALRASFSKGSTIAGELQDRLGVFWPRHSTGTDLDIDDFLSPELHHHRSDDVRLAGNPRFSDWVRSSFEILDRWTDSEPTEADLVQLDRHRAAFQEAIPAFGAAVVNGLRASRELRTTRELLAERDTRIETLNRVIAVRDERSPSATRRSPPWNRFRRSTVNKSQIFSHRVRGGSPHLFAL